MEKQEKNQVLEVLRQLMADTLAFKLKVQYCHHNVRGINFVQLHEYFQELYEELESAYDVIGEQIRIVGDKAPGSLRDHLENSNLDGISNGRNLTPEEMVTVLYEDNDSIRNLLRKGEELAGEFGEEAILDFFVERHREHDMHHYFLSSLSMHIN